MKKNLIQKFGKKGFTLVEIMIVVAIIGLLAAIAIPNLLRARMNSNDGAIQSDLKTFSTAVESYRAAQNPPTYPATLPLLTTPAAGQPPYLDTTWSVLTVANPKHGHTLTYSPAAAVLGRINAYLIIAERRANESSNAYCIDQSGVLRVDVNEASYDGESFAAGTYGCGAGAAGEGQPVGQ